MPATFRALLQGVSASIPQIVQLMQWEKQYGLAETEVETRKGTLAESKRQFDENKPTREALARTYNVGADLTQEQLNLAKAISQDNIDMSRMKKESEALSLKMKEAEFDPTLKYNEELRKKTLQKYDDDHKKNEKDLLEIMSRADAHNAQASVLGLQARDLKLKFGKDVLTTAIAFRGGNDFDKTFLDKVFKSGTIEEIQSYVADNLNNFSPQAVVAVNNLIPTIQSIFQTVEGNKLQYLSNLGAGKEPDEKVLKTFDNIRGEFIRNFLKGYGIESMTPNFLPNVLTPKETSGEQSQGTGFSVLNPLRSVVEKGGAMGSKYSRYPLYGATAATSPTLMGMQKISDMYKKENE